MTNLELDRGGGGEGGGGREWIQAWGSDYARDVLVKRSTSCGLLMGTLPALDTSPRPTMVRAEDCSFRGEKSIPAAAPDSWTQLLWRRCSWGYSQLNSKATKAGMRPFYPLASSFHPIAPSKAGLLCRALRGWTIPGKKSSCRGDRSFTIILRLKRKAKHGDTFNT